MDRVTLIVNPQASAVSEATLADVERALGRAADVTTLRTERPGHATELAADAGGGPVVVYAGDGGANEVLNGVAEGARIGFVPGGGTSVLPRALGLPRDAAAAAERIAQAIAAGRTRRVSLGRVNGRRFAFSAGVGLDAELVRRVDSRGRSLTGRRSGDRAFVWAAVRYLGERGFRIEPALEIEGVGRAAFILVANGRPYTYAGRFALDAVPEASFELGLDFVGATRVTPLSIPRLLAYAMRGRGQNGAPDVLYGHDVDRIVVTGDVPLPLQADGEDLGDVTRVVFEAERGTVDVLV